MWGKAPRLRAPYTLISVLARIRTHCMYADGDHGDGEVDHTLVLSFNTSLRMFIRNNVGMLESTNNCSQLPTV